MSKVIDDRDEWTKPITAATPEDMADAFRASKSTAPPPDIIVELVRVDDKGTKWHSRRDVVEADNIYGPAGKTVAKQDYENPDWDADMGAHHGAVSSNVGDEDIYLRPRPPSMNGRSNMRYVLKKYGALELGFRFADRQFRLDKGVPGKFEIWKRNPNEGTVRMLGDCMPVVLIEDGVEVQWQLWQTMLCGQVFFHNVASALRELRRRHGREFEPMMMGKALPPSPELEDMPRLEGHSRLALPPAPYGKDPKDG